MSDKAKDENVNIIKIIKTIWKVLEKLLVAAIIFVSLVILTQRASNNEKAFLGFRIFKVETGSMIPVYNIGDVILVKEKQLSEIKIGDDITYTGTAGTMKGRLVTHRVVEIEEVEGQIAFRTKGVSNTVEDKLLVQGGQVNGVVLSKIYTLTLITSALTNHCLLYFCGILPLTIFIFLSFARGRKKRYEE